MTEKVRVNPREFGLTSNNGEFQLTEFETAGFDCTKNITGGGVVFLTAYSPPHILRTLQEEGWCFSLHIRLFTSTYTKNITAGGVVFLTAYSRIHLYIY